MKDINPSSLRSYLVNMTKAEYKDRNCLTVQYPVKVVDIEEMTIVDCSCIAIHKIGIIYYDPLQNACFYYGNFPPYSKAIKMQLTQQVPQSLPDDIIKGLLPNGIAILLIQAFIKKESIKISYARRLEKELFSFPNMDPKKNKIDDIKSLPVKDLNPFDDLPLF